MGKLTGTRGPDPGRKQKGPQALIDALLYVEEMTAGSGKLSGISRDIAKRLRSKEDGGYNEDPRTIAADVLRDLADLV